MYLWMTLPIISATGDNQNIFYKRFNRTIRRTEFYSICEISTKLSVVMKDSSYFDLCSHQIYSHQIYDEVYVNLHFRNCSFASWCPLTWKKNENHLIKSVSIISSLNNKNWIAITSNLFDESSLFFVEQTSIDLNEITYNLP